MRNVKYVYNSSTASILSTTNVHQTQPILNSNDGYTSIQSGTYGNGRALVFYKQEILNQFLKKKITNWDINIFVNMAKWLTQDACTNFQNCLMPIEFYQSNLKKNNLVILHTQFAKINVSNPNLHYKLVSGSWGIIFVGTFWNNRFDADQSYLMNKFGICVTKNQGIVNSKSDLNWCRNISAIGNLNCR